MVSVMVSDNGEGGILPNALLDATATEYEPPRYAPGTESNPALFTVAFDCGFDEM
jgi:hypothetical protein